MPKKQTAMAYPVLGYELLEHKDDPTICVLMIMTEDGPKGFALLKQHAEVIGDALVRKARAMPMRTTQN